MKTATLENDRCNAISENQTIKQEENVRIFKTRNIRPGEAAELRHLARPNFSVVEQLFISKPKLGVVAQTEDGKIAGGAFLVIVNDGNQKIGCVDIIFVLPQYRGSGVGKMLYHAAVEALHAQKCSTIMALVRGDNSQSLCRFKAEGLMPTTLHQLGKIIGQKALLSLFIKTAALACATGCWILCDRQEEKLSAGSSTQNLLRTFLTNGIMLTLGSIFCTCFHRLDYPWWNFLAALCLLGVITLGETIGMRLTKAKWQFVMPQAGMVPSAIAALLGGFYPMMGHWYVTERENSDEYRRRMAAPAVGAWILLMIVTVLSWSLNTMHPFFTSVSDIALTLLLIFTLPCYPCDTYAGKRVREGNKAIYTLLLLGSIVILGVVVYSSHA